MTRDELGRHLVSAGLHDCVEIPSDRATITFRTARLRSADVAPTKPACGLGVLGLGWVKRPGLVVTNAHVLAGQDDTIASLWQLRRSCKQQLLVVAVASSCAIPSGRRPLSEPISG